MKKTNDQKVNTIINKVVGFNEEFDNLDNIKRTSVLSYIINHDSKVNVYGKRGYDIVKQSFFVVVYYSKERNIISKKGQKNEFANFSEYYAFLNGDIYLKSCYFGYDFSEDEISKYKIVLTNLNFDSFLNYDIDSYTFENLKDQNIGNNNYIDNIENISSLEYKITKSYDDGLYVTTQVWLDSQHNIVLKNAQKYEWFFDFAHFLKGDVSNANFVMCDGIENISKIKNLKIDGIKVRSEAAKKMNIKLDVIPSDKYELINFDEAEKNELVTVNQFLSNRMEENESYKNIVSYITDIHLMHRYKVWNCETFGDMYYVTNIIAKEIADDCAPIKLIGGDIASDYNVYKVFTSALAKMNNYGKIFLTLGNHELWPFSGDDLDEIINRYRDLITKKGMYLVHNNIFYLDDYLWKEVSTEELKTISEKDLRNKMRSAQIIIFGGLAFAGKNQKYNANIGIYRQTISRNDEIKESEDFELLYSKVTKALHDKNVIIFTHMPFQDWSSNNKLEKGFVYVSGHNHKNYFQDNGKERVYSDNQIGYKQKNVRMKHFYINMKYDWFSDYQDGIYEITKEDYENFYKGLGEGITLSREYAKINMLKKSGAYMFLLTSLKGSLLILNGGAVKKADNHSLEYFYNNLPTYSRSIIMFLEKYSKCQEEISKIVKSIGGDGRIHGSIIDIDFYSHLYINPLDGKVTPYFANSITDKYVYRNFPSLLKHKCPLLFENYQQKLIDSKNRNSLLILDNNMEISSETTFVYDTKMYKVSRILSGLQYTTKYNIVRLWNDSIINGPSEENGRLIVSNFINPETIRLNTVAYSQRLQVYRKELSKFTHTIEVLEYHGKSATGRYKCKICGYTWEQKPGQFNHRGIILHVCPNCKK